MASALGIVATLYCLMVGGLYVFQRRLMYVPSRARPDPETSGVPEMRRVTLTTNDGLELAAWYHPARDGATPTLIYFHGNDEHLGTRADKARRYFDAGYGVLLVSWRGYGGNPGKPSEAGLYADGRAALAFLRKEGVGPDRIVLYGESLGSGVAVQLATESPPAALVLEAPYSSIVDVAARRHPYAPVRVLLKDRYESEAKIGAVEAPVLIIHGERDKTVPIDFGRRVFAAASEPKQVHYFAEAEHCDLYDHGAAEKVLDFLAKVTRSETV